MAKNKLIREKLMAIHPFCHWCGVEVIYFKVDEMAKGGPPPNFATLDHLYTKWEPEKRYEAFKKEDSSRHVLACYKCNKKRNDDFMKKLSKSAAKIRTSLGQERKKILSKQPRPQVFRNLESIKD